MRFVTDEKSEQEYTDFLESHERCNFQQSIEWAKVKTSWKHEVILAEDTAGKIIGSLMVWIRKIPIFGNIMYSARGPVCDIHNMDVLMQLTEGVKELAKKYNAIVVRIEPDIVSSDETFRNIMLDLGYQIKDDAKNFREEIQPRYVFRLDTKDKTEEQLARYNEAYIGTAVKWAIRNEIRRRYKWYSLKTKKESLPSEEDVTELRSAVYKTILSIDEMTSSYKLSVFSRQSSILCHNPDLERARSIMGQITFQSSSVSLSLRDR